jgi:hypothetical protein
MQFFFLSLFPLLGVGARRSLVLAWWEASNFLHGFAAARARTGRKHVPVPHASAAAADIFEVTFVID